MIDFIDTLSDWFIYLLFDLRPDEDKPLEIVTKDCNGHNQARACGSSEIAANFNSNKRSMDKKNVQWNFSPIDL